MARRQELEQAKRLLSKARLLTLTGVGGVGKTRLALRVAKDVSRAFPDGVWLVQLAPLNDPQLVTYAVAEVLGVGDETGRDPLVVLVEHLRERRPLLILDNCEHLLEACARFATAVLLESPGVRILATSRHRLGVTGEQLLPVPPLRVPEPGQLDEGADAVGTFGALALFADRAAAVDPGFAVTAENQESVARLCRQLDGLPLAIELAARMTQALAVPQLVERLDDRYRLLTRGHRTAETRHQSLRAAVDWSYELCTPCEQRVWAQLSTFNGTFDLAAAAAVGAGEGIEPADVLDAVEGLVDKSVLLSESNGAVERYRWLHSLREYGMEKLVEFDTGDAAHRRHRDHYLRLAEDYEKQWFGPRQAEIVNHLWAERDNLRAVLRYGLTRSDEVQAGLHLAGTLWFYWNCRGESAEARYWTRKLALREGRGRRSELSKAQWAGAALVLIHSRSATALLASDRDGSRAQPYQAPPPLAESTRGREDVLSFAVLGRIDLACTLVLQGRPEQAVPLCEDALVICRAHREQWMRSYLLRTLALARWMMGEHDAASAHARECLGLDHAVLGIQGISRTLDLLAASAAGQGAAERTAVLLGASERIWPDTSRGPAESHRKAGRRPVSETQARESLGDHGFERAFRWGGELSTEEAVAYALEVRLDRSEQSETRPSSAMTYGAQLALTRREMQVAEFVTRGLTNKQIATQLVLSRRTIEGHVQHILVKLGFTSRSQLAAWFTAERR